MNLRICLLLVAGSFVIYEGLLCSYHAERASKEAQGVIQALKDRDEAVLRWQKQQERIHEDQMAILKRIEDLE